MGYRLNRLDEPIFMAVPKPMLIEFGIHYRSESCGPERLFSTMLLLIFSSDDCSAPNSSLIFSRMINRSGGLLARARNGSDARNDLPFPLLKFLLCFVFRDYSVTKIFLSVS